jgi:hypothetical protein
MNYRLLLSALINSTAHASYEIPEIITPDIAEELDYMLCQLSPREASALRLLYSGREYTNGAQEAIMARLCGLSFSDFYRLTRNALSRLWDIENSGPLRQMLRAEEHLSHYWQLERLANSDRERLRRQAVLYTVKPNRAALWRNALANEPRDVWRGKLGA